MKKLTLFLISALFVSGAFAQMRVNSSGRIDISSPISSPTNATPITFRVGSFNAGFTGSSHNTNVFFGFCALAWNTTGRDNVAIGFNALLESTTGDFNTAVGTSALFSNGNGWGNTAIGHEAGADIMGLHNTTTIGFGVWSNSSNEVRIGNDNVVRIGGIVDWNTHSDGRTKTNINANVPGLDFINRLQPITYNLDIDAVDNLRGATRTQSNRRDSLMQQSLSQEQLNLIEQGRAERQRQIQTGFVAQDVAETARSIGYEFSGVVVDDIGVYGLRYGQFVVPLVRAVQELSEQNETLLKLVEDLQHQVAELRNPAGTVRQQSVNDTFDESSASAIDGAKTAVLHQNTPNPFSQSTQIRFYLPETVRNANLIIFDMQGKQLMQIPLTQRGDGVEIIQGSQLAPGIYLYALIADGREIDVKRMILTQ